MDKLTIAGLEVEVVGAELPPTAPVVVLLHGFDMLPGDLSPFGSSLRLPVRFLFPRAPIDLRSEGRRGFAWWPIDTVARDREVELGVDRDLSDTSPRGLPAAREQFAQLLREIRAMYPTDQIAIGGFSQGAILTCDFTLRSGISPAGVILLSAARVTVGEWRRLMPQMKGQNVFQSHGSADRELSFEVAKQLCRELVDAGAVVTWVEFDGAHEIPLVVWRKLKVFLRQTLAISG